jgi:signal transduction histidine kinase
MPRRRCPARPAHGANGGPVAGATAPEVTYQQIRGAVRDDTLDSLLTQGGIALGGVGVVAVGFGWLMAERVLRPLHRVTETARRVADRNLHERIALTGPRDEIKELADTFDSMLERLDRAFDGHPDAPQQMRDLGQTLLAVNARHERLIDGLLTLARSEQTVTVHDPVDLADIARHVVEQRTQSTVEVVTSLDPGPTTGDPVLLERITQNLVQNAIAYNVPDGWVSVRTSTRGDAAELVVTNTGPVVPAYEIPGLFEPFRRLQDRAASGGGTGLGLSIVQSVARAHGGDVAAHPHDDGGLVVTVTLPLDRTREPVASR